MSEPQWSTDPQKQAEFMNDFRAQTTAELSAIRRRLTWMLTPTILVVLLAVLGLTVFMTTRVIDIHHQVANIDESVKNVGRTLSYRQAAGDQETRPYFMPNGLSDAEREEFYHLEEGSEVFPLDWLRALENSQTKNPYINDLYGMGFLRDWDPNNKDGLPVGLTSAPTRGLEPLGKMIGLNCAACHVGEMTYQGKRIRIDGAPNMLDTRTFFASLIESSFATIEDSDKLLAFISRLKEERADQKKAARPAVRSAAQRIFRSMADKSEKVLIEALVPVIKKVVEDAKNDKLELPELLKDANKDASQLRTRMLGKFDNSKFKTLLDNSSLKSKLEALVDKTEHESTLVHTFEEIYIGVRLLRARAVFLKKLGGVGTDKRTEWGAGRVDAFGSARAFLFEDGYKPVNPVSYPFIWGLYRIDWFHYDNNTTTFLQRNCGQALGVGAVHDPKTLASSLHPRNLYRLEELATKLKPAVWPEDILGNIDTESAKRGKVHFDKHCVACHKTPGDGEKFKDVTFDLDKLGTDPLRAKMFAEKLPDGKMFYDAIGDAMDKISKKAYEDNNVTKEEIEKFSRAPIPGSPVVTVVWRGPGKYSARPLDGVWATGPFLHNGSVPTIDDLLKPAKDRPKEFFVGNREFDAHKLGYISTPPSGRQNNYDTKVEGNHNTGHEYGALSDTERRDLLEYLKTDLN
ncbi:MAG: hypothetical protein HY289_03515 [Planctomycetes bacterium]|nr:hypothetical protein [Planctomycetota bacterium]